MENIERRIRRAARAMTRREVIIKAIARQLSWVQAAEVLGITARHMRRIRRTIERYGMEALMDHRGGRPRRRRIKVGTVALLIRLKRDIYPDFSVQHFYEQVTEQHRVKVSYNWLRLMLQEAEVVEKEPARGKYRRRRERRPMVGMLVHLAPRPMSGSRVCRCRTWWWRSTTPTAAFCTRGSLRRKARPRPSPRWSRWCATTAVSANSTPIAAAICATARGPAQWSTSRTARSAKPYTRSASTRSWPVRRRPAAAASAPSAPSGTAAPGTQA